MNEDVTKGYTLATYAENIRRRCGHMLVPVCQSVGPESKLAEMLIDMMNEATDIANGLKMQEELADPESYSLAALSSVVDTRKPTDSETGYEDRD